MQLRSRITRPFKVSEVHRDYHSQRRLTSANLGTAVALYEVGAALGALSCAFIGDYLGRRRTVFIAGCVCLVGIVIQASPFSLGQLIAGRIITGA